jgi:hypothetical protein
MRLRKARIGVGKLFHVERKIASEKQESEAFYDYTQLLPAIKDLTVHFSNEGKRTLSFAGSLKRIGGIPKGFPDFAIFLANYNYHSLFIEMKKVSEKGKKLRAEQLMWRDRLLKAGHYAIICYGCDEGIQVINDYLQNKI